MTSSIENIKRRFEKIEKKIKRRLKRRFEKKIKRRGIKPRQKDKD